jgi:hypothetical protein
LFSWPIVAAGEEFCSCRFLLATHKLLLEAKQSATAEVTNYKPLFFFFSFFSFLFGFFSSCFFSFVCSYSSSVIEIRVSFLFFSFLALLEQQFRFEWILWAFEVWRRLGFGTPRKWLWLWWVFNPQSPVHVAWYQDLFLKNILHSSTTLRRIACIGYYSSLRCMVLIWCLLMRITPES